MRIGIPREIKDGEYRVPLTPAAVRALTTAGHEVIVEAGLGAGVGFPDEEFLGEEARIGDPWDSDLVVKVKELQEAEYKRPHRRQTIFCFQHFGPKPALLEAALASGATFIAFETVGQDDGSLPILAPMSAIAGRLSVQVGAWCLQKQNGGSGVLLPGVDGIAPGRVLIFGAGNVGANALAVANGIGAEVIVFVRTNKRILHLRGLFPRADFHIGAEQLPKFIPTADLIVGGVLVPGKMSPKLITRGMLRSMRPGSGLVDVGIDQGGIAETSRPTSHSKPTFVEEGVVHYCVPNMPAAAARTASLALERVVLPYVFEICGGTLSDALRTGVQVKKGKITHEFLARDTGRPYHSL